MERVRKGEMKAPTPPQTKGDELLQTTWTSLSFKDGATGTVTWLQVTWSPHVFQVTNTATPGKTKQRQESAMTSFNSNSRNLVLPPLCRLPSCGVSPSFLKISGPFFGHLLSPPKWATDTWLYGCDFFSSAGTSQRSTTLKADWR